MKPRKTLMALFLTAFVTPALATEYSCVVTAFDTFSDNDTNFVANSLGKTFRLSVGRDTIDVTMQSDVFRNITNTYQIQGNKFSTIIAIHDS